MSIFRLLGIAVGLAMDAFAVAVATGVRLESVTPRHAFRLAFHFGLFQAIMPVIGWLVGSRLSAYAGTYGQLAAFGLLACVGAKMLWESRGAERNDSRGDPTRGLTLIGLSVATSLDALAVGASMALLRVSIWLPSAVIGLMAAGLTMVGISFGARLGSRCGRWAERAGAVMLLLIALLSLL